jgi:ubiquinone biosynthesis protein UbiJ
MVLDRLESILNRNVAESRRAQALARQLDGRVMSLVVEGTPVTIFLRADGGRLALTPRHDGAADASISGTPIALFALAGPRGEGAVRGGGVRIEGDAEVAQRFRDLLAETRPDFEEELSHVVGDVAARRFANFARDLMDWGRRTSASFAGSVAEYLQEEGRDLPTRTEIEEFLTGVDRLRDDAERLEARLARLETAASRPARGPA